MKVTGVKVTPYPASSAPGPARAPRGQSARGGSVVELSTDTGLIGIGIAPPGMHAQIESAAQEFLVGADPRGVAGLWERMLAAQSARRGADLQSEALAVLDVALWDLKAKANDEPLWQALGGARPKANAYASYADDSLSDEDLSAWYAAMARDFGLRGGKLRVGSDADTDLRRLGLVHAALLHSTPGPVLMIDAQRHWSPKQAIRRLREIEEQLDLTWVEGTTQSWDFPGSKQVSNAIRAAVCVGRGLATFGEFLPHLHHRSADVIQIDIGVTGITGALQLADAAFGFELPVTLAAAPGNIHAHLGGAMPYFDSLEVVDAAPACGIYSSDVRIENGHAVAGDAPGNGLIANLPVAAGRQRAVARDAG